MAEKQRISDQELVTLYRTGNEEAFETLLKRHRSRVYTTIYLIVKDRYLAEDLLQEVFIKVVNQIKSGKYNEEGKFLPWLMRISHNMAIDQFRRNKRYPVVTFEDGSPLADSMKFADKPFEDEHIRQEMHSRLRSLIKELPETQRQVLIMRHYIGMSFQEIADKTGVSINTALGRMRYAILNLRKQMDKHKIAYDKDFYPE